MARRTPTTVGGCAANESASESESEKELGENARDPIPALSIATEVDL